MYNYICRERERDTKKIQKKLDIHLGYYILFYLGAAVVAPLIDCQTNPSGTRNIIPIWLWVKCLGIPELDGSLNISLGPIIKYWRYLDQALLKGPCLKPFQGSGLGCFTVGCLGLPQKTTTLPQNTHTQTSHNMHQHFCWPYLTHTQKSKSLPCAVKNARDYLTLHTSASQAGGARFLGRTGLRGHFCMVKWWSTWSTSGFLSTPWIFKPNSSQIKSLSIGVTTGTRRSSKHVETFVFSFILVPLELLLRRFKH